MYLPLWIIIPPWKRFKKTGLSFPWTTLTYRKKWEITTPSIKKGSILPEGQTNNQGLNPLSANSFHWLAVWWCQEMLLTGLSWLPCCTWLQFWAPPGCQVPPPCLSIVIMSLTWDNLIKHQDISSLLMHSHGPSIWSSNLIVRRNWMLVTTGAYYVMKTKSRKNNMLHWLTIAWLYMKMWQSHLQNKM